MKLASRWNWLAVFVAVVGMVTVGAGLPGCSPQDKGTTDTDAAEGDTEEAVEEVVEEIDVAPPMPAEDATGPELDTPATDEAVEEETAETETTEPEVVDTEEVQMEAVEPEVADPEATEPEAAATEEELLAQLGAELVVLLLELLGLFVKFGNSLLAQIGTLLANLADLLAPDTQTRRVHAGRFLCRR